MKLRRPRLKRVVGWASALTGVLLVGAAAASRLERPGTLPVNAVWLRGLRPGIGHVDFVSRLKKDRAALGQRLTYLNEKHIFPARGLHISFYSVGPNETVGLLTIDFIGDDNMSDVYARDPVAVVVHASNDTVQLNAKLGRTFVSVLAADIWLWALGTPMLAAPISLGVWSRLRKKRRNGACKGCGYDMAGLPKSSACPECGAALLRAGERA